MSRHRDTHNHFEDNWLRAPIGCHPASRFTEVETQGTRPQQRHRAVAGMAHRHDSHVDRIRRNRFRAVGSTHKVPNHGSAVRRLRSLDEISKYRPLLARQAIARRRLEVDGFNHCTFVLTGRVNVRGVIRPCAARFVALRGDPRPTHSTDRQSECGCPTRRQIDRSRAAWRGPSVIESFPHRHWALHQPAIQGRSVHFSSRSGAAIQPTHRPSGGRLI